MPLGESMISSLKSNKRIKLDKTTRFKKTLGGYGKNKASEFDFPKANPKLLEQLRLKTKKNHNRTLVIYTVSFVILFVVTFYSLYYFNII